MMNSRTDNLVDLKDHCLLCYRDIASVGSHSGQSDTLENSFHDCLDENAPENLGKRFIKLLCRQLDLPLAKLTVVLDETSDPSPRTILKRWEDLIKGELCSRCYPLAKSYCDLYYQMDVMKLNLNSLIHDMEQHILLTDQDSDFTEGKNLLRAKWEADGTNPKQMFKLLEKFRGNTVSKAAKLKTFPVMQLKRLSDSECLRHTTRLKDISGDVKMERRDSLTEDSGVSSPTSMRQEEVIQQQYASTEDSSSCNVTDIPVKEFKVMRKVFTCRKCSHKCFSREKYTEHCAACHPKPSTATFSTSTLKIKKVTFVCPEKDCGAKFLSKENLITHRDNDHPSVPLVSNKLTDEPPKTFVEENMVVSNDEAKKRKKYMKKRHACDFENCRKKFHTFQELQFHNQFHHTHPCLFCGSVCKNPKVLAKHELRRHSDKSTSIFKDIKCPRCSFITKNYMSYLTHFYSHLDARPSFKCLKCNANFSLSTSLRKHSLKCCNTSSSPISTKENATVDEAETNTTNPEAIPIEKSEKSQDYLCNICSLSCHSFLALSTHIASHDPNIYSCDECERFFQCKDSFEKHRAIIHLKFKICRKYCESCKDYKTFRSILEFNDHVKQHDINKEAKKKDRLEGNALPPPVSPLESPETDENRSNASNDKQQDVEDVPTVHNGGNLAERVKLRQRDADNVFTGERRKTKHRKLVKERDDVTCEPAKKKRKKSINDNQSKEQVELHNETEAGGQTLDPHENERVDNVIPKRISTNEELMSPQIQPPLLSPVLVQNETLQTMSKVASNEVVSPEEKLPNVFIKKEPKENISKRLDKWMEERQSPNDTIEITDTDEEQEEVEQKPIVTNVVLSQRVSSWLTDRLSIQVLPTPERPEPKEEDIITID